MDSDIRRSTRKTPYGNIGFDMCIRGDLEGVHEILAKGKILLTDIEEDGWDRNGEVTKNGRGTLLHVTWELFDF